MKTSISNCSFAKFKNVGRVFIDGEELTKGSIKLKEKIGCLPSEVHLYNDLIVKRMLDYHASFYKKGLNSNRKRLCDCLKIEEDKKSSLRER